MAEKNSSKKKIAAEKARKAMQADKKNMKGRELRNPMDMGPEFIFDPDTYRGFVTTMFAPKGNKPVEYRMPIPKDAGTRKKKWSQR